MNKGIIYFIILLLSIMFLFAFQCEEPPSGVVTIPLETYDSLKAGQTTIYDTVEVVKYDTLEITKFDTLYIERTITNYDTLYITEIDTVFVYSVPVANSFLVPDTVRVDTVFTTASISLAPENMLDDVPFRTRQDKGTRWAVPGYPHEIAFSFDKLVYIDSVFINVFAWNEDYTHDITVFNYPDSLTKFETKKELYSGHKIGIKTKLLYLRIDGGKNSWTDIGEVKFKGYEISNTE